MKMSRPLILCTGLLAFLPVTALAQDSPKYEIFAGYSYLRGYANKFPNGFAPPAFSVNGWESSLTTYVNNWAGIEADFSGHYGGAGDNGAYEPSFTFMLGPHFAFRNHSRVTPFTHLLVGGVHGSSTELNAIELPCFKGQPCPSTIVQTQTSLTAAAGAGIDIKVSRSVSIRAVQADYLYAGFAGNHQKDARISAGIVFSFGGR